MGELGSLGAESQEQEAATVAALIGKRSPEEVFAMAAARFRCLPLAELTAADLELSHDGGLLYEKSRAATLGDVDAFVSHSWTDPAESKWNALQAWGSGWGPGPRTVWLDKACIDQSQVHENLAGLPVFISGCQTMVVLVGPSYPSRLWCCVELFVYARLRSDPLVAMLLDHSLALEPLLRSFDAELCKCTDARDRERLLAVVETGFGTLDGFNAYVRRCFIDALMASPSRRIEEELSGPQL